MAKAVKKQEKTGISFDGVSFNKGFIISHKTEADFLKAMDEKQNVHVFADAKDRTAKLKEVYALVQKKEAPVEDKVKK